MEWLAEKLKQLHQLTANRVYATSRIIAFSINKISLISACLKTFESFTGYGLQARTN
jgi:hypothetical protein